MTQTECLEVIQYMARLFPNWKVNDIIQTTEAWHSLLYEYSQREVVEAIKIYAKTNLSGFPPSIGFIVQNIAEMHPDNDDSQINESQAWAMVLKALRNGNYGAEEEFNKLPNVVKRAVGSPAILRQWASAEEATLSVQESIFKKSYKSTLEQEKRIVQMPIEIQKQLLEVTKMVAIPDMSYIPPETDGISAENQKMLDEFFGREGA